MSVLDLAEAKTHLNITVGTYDAEIQSTIDEAEAAISARVGPLTPVPRTSRVDGYSNVLVLPFAPVVSLTSVTPAGAGATPMTLSALYVETATGVISWDRPYSGYFWYPKYTVVYSSGWSPVPLDLVRAVKDLTKSMWKTQRGGTQRPGTGGEPLPRTYLPGAPNTLPPEVESAIQPYRQSVVY